MSFIYLSKPINEAITWPSLRPKTEKTFPHANFCFGVEEGCIGGWYNKFNFKINFNQCIRKKLNWKGTTRVPSAVLHFWSFLTSFCLSCILKPWAATVESSIFMSGLQQKSIVWTRRRRPSIESTVINPNVFLLSMELLAWLVQTNCYLAWTSNSLLAFPSRHSGSLENNQDNANLDEINMCGKIFWELDLEQSG